MNKRGIEMAIDFEELSPYEKNVTRGSGIGQGVITPENMPIMHEKLLETVSYFDKFCHQHNLTYCLVWGTCIGAIRHQGFIPWDDDVDICMPRRDYEKLFEIWPKDGDIENFSLYRTTNKFCAKVPIGLFRNNNTTVIYDYCQDQDIKHGVKLDIEPWDEVPQNRLLQMIQYLCFRVFEVYSTQRLPKSSPSLRKFGRLKLTVVRLMLSLVKSKEKRFAIASTALKIATQFNGKDCEYVRCNAVSTPCKREDMFNTIRVPFENTELDIPKGYDNMLRLQTHYGDYMQKPPLEKRVPNVGYVFYDLNSACEKYKGIYYC